MSRARHDLLSSANGGIVLTTRGRTPWSAANERVIARHRARRQPALDRHHRLTGAGAFRPSRVYFRGRSGAGPLTWFGAAENFVNDPGCSRHHLRVSPSIPATARTSRWSPPASAKPTSAAAPATASSLPPAGHTVGATRAWTEVGGAFDAASGNLPDFPMLSVAWAPDADPANPSTLLVASDAGVLRLNGNQWERVGPNLPNVSCQTLRIDSTVAGAPPVIRVGTYGRSAWEFVRPTGPSLVVRAQLGFGERRVGTDTRLPLALYNVGDAPVHIERMDTFGDFTFDPADSPGLRHPRGRKQTAQRPLSPQRRRTNGTTLQSAPTIPSIRWCNCAPPASASLPDGAASAYAAESISVS